MPVSRNTSRLSVNGPVVLTTALVAATIALIVATVR